MFKAHLARTLRLWADKLNPSNPHETKAPKKESDDYGKMSRPEIKNISIGPKAIGSASNSGYGSVNGCPFGYL